MRSVVVGVLAFAALACGRSPLDDEAPEDLVVDAGIDASPSDVIGGGDVASPFCMLGVNETCNDYPADLPVGICRASADSPTARFCECALGSSIDRGTGRCREGTPCAGADADRWPLDRSLDRTGCAARPIRDCGSFEGGEDAIDPQLNGIVSACKPPGDISVRVELHEGCVDRLEVRPDPSPSSPAFVNCLVAALTAQRWSCAGLSGVCGLDQMSLIR